MSRLSNKVRELKEAFDAAQVIIQQQEVRENDLKKDISAEYLRSVQFSKTWVEHIEPLSGVQYPSLRNEDIRTLPLLSMFKNLMSVHTVTLSALKQTSEELNLVLNEMDTSLDMSLSNFRTIQAGQSKNGKGQAFLGDSQSARTTQRPETPPASLDTRARIDSPVTADSNMVEPTSDKKKLKNKSNGSSEKKATATLGNLLGGTSSSTPKK